MRIRRIKYKDKWGELWERVSETHVRRISDGNVGGFFGRQGLEVIVEYY